MQRKIADIFLASKPSDLDVLAEGVFDHPLLPESWREFLADERHHLALARTEADTIVGMASAVHYVHPDKPAELWINEVGVSECSQRQGLATQLIQALFELAKDLGCREAWVLTDADNEAANALYRKAKGKPSPCVMYSFDLS